MEGEKKIWHYCPFKIFPPQYTGGTENTCNLLNSSHPIHLPVRQIEIKYENDTSNRLCSIIDFLNLH
jgi:hypothetical protein